MPPLRKDRTQASRLQQDNTLQFNTFINVSIPKAPQVLSEEALQLRPTIPAKTPAEAQLATASVFLSLRKLALGELKDNSHTRKKPIGHINRPPNAFILFRRAQCSKMSGTSGSHQQRISNLAASFWRSLTHPEQSAWYALAQDVKKFHQLLFPDYQFIPHPQNATDEEKHRKTNLSAQPPSTAEQDVVIEEELSACIFRHAGEHVDLDEVERFQRMQIPLSFKPSKKGRRQRPNIPTSALPAGSTFVFSLSDTLSVTSSEQSSHPPTPCTSPLQVDVPVDVSTAESLPQYTTTNLVNWNPNYSFVQYSGNSTPTAESATTIDPLATITTAPPAPTTTGSPSLGPMTPEPYPGYFESQTGTSYDVKIYGAQMTQGEGISQHAESPSLPAIWGTGQDESTPVIADPLTYPFGQVVEPFIATGADMQAPYDILQCGLPYRFSIQFREWIADDAWSRENNVTAFGKPSPGGATSTEARSSGSPLQPFPVYPPTYVFS